MQRRKLWKIVAVAGALVAVGALVTGLRTKVRPAVGPDIPVAEVKRGDLSPRIHAKGELSAEHSALLMAPAIGGGALQITHLLRTGTVVKAGDVVVEFDPSEQEYKLEQNRSDLLQAEQEIDKADADAAVQTAQDKSAHLKDEFDVRSAELDVSKNELLSVIDAKKNDLALSEAKRALQQLEQDIQSHTASNQASIAVAREKHNKAELAIKQAQQNIESMRVRAPIGGLAVVERNTGGGFFFGGGGSFPDYREGDQAQSGSIIARVIDPAGMELSAKIGEVERGSLQVGQAAEIHLDALPGVTFHGRVKTASGAASGFIFESSRTFDVTVEITGSDPRLRPGYSAEVIFLGAPKKDVLYVPRPSIFKQDEKPVVYAKRGGRFEVSPVKIIAETESRVAIEGLKDGMEVALVNPTGQGRKTTESAAPTGGPQ